MNAELKLNLEEIARQETENDECTADSIVERPAVKALLWTNEFAASGAVKGED